MLLDSNLKFIDSHCHLDFKVFDECLDHEIKLANERGVALFVVPSVSMLSCEKVSSLSQQYSAILPALGLHPFFMQYHTPKHIQSLGDLLTSNKVVAIGEFGLDYQLSEYDLATQTFYFHEQLDLAQALELPVILHVRKAHEDVLKFLKKQRFHYGGIIHAYSGSYEQALRYIEMGFKLGFGGAATYDRAKRQHDLIKRLPLDALVFETDSPDMQPSFIGKNEPNSPIHLPRIAKCISDIRGEAIEKIAPVVFNNTLRALGLD